MSKVSETSSKKSSKAPRSGSFRKVFWARFFGILLACGFAFMGFHFTVKKTFVNPYPVVCDLVYEKIYLDNKAMEKWRKTCMRRTRLVSPYSKKELIVKDLNNVLALLKVSHLEIFRPSEVRQIWKGQNLETGIESEFVDSELVIFKVHPKSPAEKAGLHRGDIITTINGEQPSPWTAVREGGSYIIQNSQGERRVPLKPAEVKRDEEIRLIPLMNKKAHLVVPSFRAEFFTDEKLNAIVKDLSFYQEIVVDLRGNSGGNFVAGLKLLSPFLCKPTVVGSLVKPRLKEKTKVVMKDDLNDMKQLELLDHHQEVVLESFPSASCFKGKVKVLVDGKTSSVAEMVAQAFKELKGAPLLGSPSRGELLVGVWYPLDELSKGTQISIPEAVYISTQGRHIENEGVKLDRVLYYNLVEMQAGIDSWVKRALD
ncbi:putative CtpA-like serine protease [compost metagenome]